MVESVLEHIAEHFDEDGFHQFHTTPNDCPFCKVLADKQALERELGRVEGERDFYIGAYQLLRELREAATEVVSQWLHDHAGGPSGLPRALESLSDTLDRIEGTDKGATDG